jgi:putative ATP-dependent endonuclease of OLD family
LEGTLARIRHIKISNFRCITEFDWWPSPGINCLIGPGDIGKSSILDAIDLCLGARRSVQFTDADFHNMDIDKPITITVTIGELDDSLKNMESYGNYLRGFNVEARTIEDEPEAKCETVLSVRLTVAGDLEPVWTLVSDRAAAQSQSRNLNWTDRVKVSPTRIGVLADYNLAWRRGSVLNRLSEERADISAALAKAAREARSSFGDEADSQLGETLGIVAKTAKELGISVGGKVKAMLDVHSASFTGGTVSLHSGDGIPLKGLGLGSTRLLVAGLQRKAAKDSTIVLIDELENGLEPHRIIRLLGSIGAKETAPPLQAFVTTHSPVAVRELNGDQLFVVRENEGTRSATALSTENSVQGAVRSFPEAFLAKSVIVCEGASEVGLLRGLDNADVSRGQPSLTALAIALVDAGGCDHIYERANAFRQLGYRVCVLRDDDKEPDQETERAFVELGHSLFKWRKGRALEDEMFLSLSDEGVFKLVARAAELHGEDLIEAHIQSASSGKLKLADCQSKLTAEKRQALAKAARTKKNAWFKTVGWMEGVGHDIVAPDEAIEAEFCNVLNAILNWMNES